MKWLRRILGKIFRRRANVFDRSEDLQLRLSPFELHVYNTDADRNGMTLHDWVRKTLNAGVSKDTRRHLLKGGHGRGEALDAAYRMLDEDDDLPEPRLRSRMSDPVPVSGHPCRNLDPRVPANYTSKDCQGVCTSRVAGYAGRPCFWGALAAKNCDAFEPKKVLPVSLPKKSSGR